MLNEAESSAITGFSISDNGIGFNNANFDSCQTSDSIHKLSKGGKGVGRFLWLKAFKEVEVDSVFSEKRKRLRRRFNFSVEDGIGDGTPVATTDSEGTKVGLVGFKKEYQGLASACKTTQKISQRILEHCLPYFVASGAPRITVKDEKEQFILNGVYKRDFKGKIIQSKLTLSGRNFDLTHIKLYSTHDRMHNIVLCADKRDVKPISLAKALETSTQFDDSDRRFAYALYVTSKYLDKHADHYRLDFDMPESAPLLGHADDRFRDLTASPARLGSPSDTIMGSTGFRSGLIPSVFTYDGKFLRFSNAVKEGAFLEPGDWVDRSTLSHYRFDEFLNACVL